MSKGLEAIKRLKWGLDITQEERIELCECIEKALKEYEQHKAIENELGIDFITLIKALREGFVDGNGEYHHFSNLFIDNIEIFDSYEKVSFYLNDYGKTWALTEEELEK